LGRIRILRSTDKVLEFEIEGEDHTLCNVLCSELFNDPHVVYASYKIDHPLIGFPRVYVETDGSKLPLTAVIDAAMRIKGYAAEFKRLFESAIKG